MSDEMDANIAPVLVRVVRDGQTVDEISCVDRDEAEKLVARLETSAELHFEIEPLVADAADAVVDVVDEDFPHS